MYAIGLRHTCDANGASGVDGSALNGAFSVTDTGRAQRGSGRRDAGACTGNGTRPGGAGTAGCAGTLGIRHHQRRSRAVDPGGASAAFDRSGTAALTRIHPASGELPELWGSGRAFAQATWRQIFEQSGERYTPATLVLYTGQTQTGCGVGSSAITEPSSRQTRRMSSGSIPRHQATPVSR